MIEEEIKHDNKLIKFLLLIFVIFLILYISKETGLYEYKAYTKSKLTEEAIKKFEKDVSEGKNVSINDYVVEEYKDYLQNNPEQFYDWDMRKNDFLRTLTFKTHEKSIFKNYKENAVSLAWGSM